MSRTEEKIWRDDVRRFGRKTKLRPNDAFAWSMLGLAHRRLMRLPTAIRDFDRAIALDPSSPGNYFEHGNARFDLGDYAGAERDFCRSIELGYAQEQDKGWADPTRTVAHYNRALCLSNLGRDEEAVAVYGEAIRLRPDYVDALNNRGNLLKDLGRYGEALADFERAIAINPNDGLFHANRGNSLIRLGRLDEAQGACETALDLNRKEPAALYNLACIAALRSEPEEAVDWLKKAIEVDPKSAADAAKDPEFDGVRGHPAFVI